MGWGGNNDSRKVMPMQISRMDSMKGLLPLKKSSKNLPPMMMQNPPSSSDNKLLLMRDANAALLDQEEDASVVAERRKIRRAEDLKRRNEIKAMELEDYTFKPEGAERLWHFENRLLMVEEDNATKKFNELLADKARKESDAQKKAAEKAARQEMLEKRKKEMEERKKEQVEEEARKKIDRAERMKKLKEKADARAKAAYDAKMKEQFLKEQEVIMEGVERETMTLEEEYERHRLKREAEDREIKERIETEEAKWSAWEEEEERREEEANRIRREKMKAQYGEERQRRAQMHRIKKEKEQQQRKLAQEKAEEACPVNQQPVIRKKRTGLITVRPSQRNLLANNSSSFQLGNPLENMTNAQLNSEQRRCAGLKRQTNLEKNQLLSSSSDNVQETPEVLLLEQKLGAIDSRIAQIKTLLQRPPVPVVVPVVELTVDFNQQVETLTSSQLTAELRKCVGLKRKLNIAIKDWQEQTPDNDEPIKHLISHSLAIDERIKSIKKVSEGDDKQSEITEASVPSRVVNETISVETLKTKEELLSMGKKEIESILEHYQDTVALNDYKSEEIESAIQTCKDQLKLFERTPFAVISSVKNDSPASAAGILDNDYICMLDSVGLPTEASPVVAAKMIDSLLEANGRRFSLCIQRWKDDDLVTRIVEVLPKVAETYTEVIGCEINPCTPSDVESSTFDLSTVEILAFLDSISVQDPSPPTVPTEKPTAEDDAAPFLTVSSVASGSPSETAGLRNGDLIVQFGEINCHNYIMSKLPAFVLDKKDCEIKIIVHRWEAERYESVALVLTPRNDWGGRQQDDSLLGCELSPCDEDYDAYDVDNNATWINEPPVDPFLVVESVLQESPAEQAGIRQGDFIVLFGALDSLVNDDDLSCISDLVASAPEESPIELTIQRWEGWDYITTKVGLVPREWSGDGRLGCTLISFKEFSNREAEFAASEYPCNECRESHEFGTSAHSAAYAGHYDCLEFLSRHYDVESKDENGRCPLFYACFGNQYETAKLLISLSTEAIESQDENGDRPLHAAASSGSIECIELLLENDASLNEQNNQGLTPVHMASNLDSLELLYYKGADILAPDSSGKLPLHHACVACDLPSVEYLCEMCPEFADTTDDFGNTPLHEAAASGFVQGIRIIMTALPADCAFNATNKKGQTCMDVARHYNHEECIKVFESYGVFT